VAITFNSEAEFEAAIAERIAKATAMAITAKKTASDPKWNAFADFPDLLAAIKATSLRPTSLPAACLLEVWKGAASASAIVKIIPVVPGPRGKETNNFVVGRALMTAEAELLLANTGVGIAVMAKKGSKGVEGDSLVRVMKFQPWAEIGAPVEAEQRLAA
jgi:hypothetical protein